MSKSTKKTTDKKGTNWGLLGGIIGVGILLLGGLLLLTQLGGDDSAISVADQRATEEAMATNAAIEANEQAALAEVLLQEYCDTHADRCLVEGDAESANVVYEFSDYSCSHCKMFSDQQYPSILAQFIETNQIKYVTVPAAILQNKMQNSVNGVLCANAAGFGVEFHQAMYTELRRADLSSDELIELGNTIGLESEMFESCVRDGAYETAASENLATAIEVGVNSTPTLLFNGERINSDVNGIIQALSGQ